MSIRHTPMSVRHNPMNVRTPTMSVRHTTMSVRHTSWKPSSGRLDELRPNPGQVHWEGLQVPPLNSKAKYGDVDAGAAGNPKLKALDRPGGNPGANGCCFSQLAYKYHLEEVAFVGDWLKISPWVASRVALLRDPS